MVATKITNDLWFGHLGDHLPKDSIDDITSVDLDLDALVAKFVQPIDHYRSHTEPNVNAQDKSSQTGSETGSLIQPLIPAPTPKESRCHAFYRMLGLPAIAADGSLVNLGFPANADYKQNNINNNIASLVKKAVSDRELQARSRANVFINGGDDAVLLALSMAVPDGQRSFAVNVGTLDDATSKPQTIPIRTQYINRFFMKDGNAIVNKFESVSHQLAPFMTDPVITANAEPRSGSESVLVGLPFMDKKDLEFESGHYAKRPGLEFILRLKLREQKLLDQLQLTGILQQIIPNFNTGTATSFTNTNGLLQLGISEDDIQKLKDIGLVDSDTVQSLFKTFKGLISMFFDATKVIENVSKEIVWIPMPGQGGPESGTTVSTATITPIKYLDSWELERRISNLKVQSLLAQYQLDIGQNADQTNLVYGDFAISEFQNTANNFDEDLSKEDSKRSSIEARGSQALKTIELLGGEVSGLGLIDIIAIYLALWMMDINTLLYLIDDAAASRLDSISELQSQVTSDRAKDVGNTQKTKDAYTKLTTTISNILSFGDYIFSRLKGSPKEGGTGSVGGTG